MAYQDDFRNKVLQALKAKNLAVDISQEATQQAIVEEVQNVAKQESRPMSPEEMKLVLQDVANQLAAEKQQFTAQSADFIAFAPQEAGGPGASYSGGGIAVSVMNKDILIIPTAGTANSINTLSQIDFKILSNPNAYGVIDPNEVKSSLYNWGERITGNTYDTPVLGIGGAWNGISYTPTSNWGVGGSQGSGIAGSISVRTGFGQIIYFKPATSTIYAGLYNDLGINVDYATRSFTLSGYNSAVPGTAPTSGFAVTFGGIGNSGDLVILGSGIESQTNTIKFLSPLTVGNGNTTDVLALGLSSSGIATTQLFVGGTGQTSNVYILSANAPSFSTGDIFYAPGIGHTVLARLAIGANNSYLFSNGTVPSWTNTIAANTVSVNNAGTATTVLYPLLNNANGAGSAVSTDSEFNLDPANNILRYQSGSIYAGTAVSAPTFTGATSLVIKPGVDALTAIQLSNNAGTSVINVNTTNSRVGINNVTAPGYALDVSGDTNVSGVYRIGATQILSSTTLSNVTISSLTQVGTISSGTWSATAITAHYGGTGLQTPFVVGDLLYANSTTTWNRLAAVTAGSFLVSNGTSTSPQYVAGLGVSVGLVNIAANTGNADNYITFANAIGGVGLSVSNQASQLTYNPGSQQLKVPYITGTAFTASNLTGTLQTASQPNVTSASALATVGTITSGIWQASSIGTTYGGTGSNLGNASGNANKIVVLGAAASGYAATLIDGSNSGYLLVANGNASAPAFSNSFSSGFTFSGLVNFSTIVPQSPNQPTSANELANKAYVDSISGGLDPHASVRLTTISAIGGSYRQSGTAGTLDGFGDYIIATAPNTLISSESGFDTVGIALTNGQRVLIKDGVLGGYASGAGAYSLMSSRTTYGGFANSYIANGIYTIASYGGAATSGWLLVRATDTDNQNGVAELTGGTFTFVEEGSIYADNGFVCTNDTTTLGQIGFGATQISWSAFSGGASLIMGQGLTKIGNTIALNFNLAQANSINSNLSRGFSLGGARTASIGSSSAVTFTVTSDADTTFATNSFTANAIGFALAGGAASRTLTVQGAGNVTLDGGNNTLTLTGSSITLTGGGNTLTLSSSSTLNLNSNTLAIASGSNNITFQSASASGTTAATIQYLVQNGTAQYQLSTATTTFGAGDLYYGGGATFGSLSRLALGTGAGTSVLIRNGVTAPMWGTIALGDSNFVSGTLTTTNGGTSNGSITTTAGQVVYTDGSKLNTTSAGTLGQVLISNGTSAPSFSYAFLAGGGTSNTISGTAISYQFAQYNATGTAISSFALPTAANSVLIAATPTTASWSNGPLGLAYGGNNNVTYIAKGIVYTNTAGTANTSEGTFTFQSGVGMTITGANTTINVGSGGGYFINGAAVVSSFAGLNGAVTISNSSSVGGTSYLSTSGNSLVLNYPGTGITGTGVANQVAYYSASSTLTGNAGLVYNPSAATGVGLSVNVNSATGTIFKIDTPVAMTAGNLIDADVNGTQRFGVDWKGMASHTATGNTALVVAGGRTLLAPANSNYAQLNFGNTNANPGSGLSSIGDLWFNGTNLYFQTGATTKFDLLVGSVSGSGTINKLVKWNTTTSLTDSNISDAGVGMTITSTSSVAAGGGATAVLTLQTLLADNSLTDRYFVRGVTSTGTRLFSVDTAGNLRATTKSFDIPHPTKEGMRLVYGVLEGPEHGVYHRGTVEGKGIIQINLPEYWHKLVGDQYTIQLTPWGNYNVSIDSKTENYFTIQLVGDFISRKFKNIKVDYIVHGSRLDAPLDTEQ